MSTVHETGKRLVIKDERCRTRPVRGLVRGALAVVAIVAGTLCASVTPASALPPDSITLWTDRGSLVAQATVVPDNSFIRIEEYDDYAFYRDVKTCPMATRCTAPLSFGPGLHIEFVAHIVTMSGIYRSSNLLVFDP